MTTDRLIAAEDYASLVETPDAKLLPRFYRAVVWSPVEGMNAAKQMQAKDFAMVRDALERMLVTVKHLHDAGVELRTGTDVLIPFSVPGAALHRELRMFERAGLTPEQALVASTRNTANVFGVEGLGTLREGAPAELAIFREDPTRDLAALDTLVAVVRDGRLYTRAQLDAQLARYRDHFGDELYDAIVTPLVRRVLAATVRE